MQRENDVQVNAEQRDNFLNREKSNLARNKFFIIKIPLYRSSIIRLVTFLHIRHVFRSKSILKREKYYQISLFI